MELRHILLLVPLLAGCYEYEPIRTTSSPVGQPVRLTLTDAGSVNLAAEIGPSVEALGGKLLDDSGNAYLVALSESRKRNGIEMDWRGEQVSISKSLVADIQQRQFSRTRTGVLSAGLVTALVLLERAFWGSGGVFGGGPPGGGTGPK
ncbi:MAG TPA: hypothetical protein VF105_00700 [Gemmatimonadaceae bacterium]